jgi:hypothetical protein
MMAGARVWGEGKWQPLFKTKGLLATSLPRTKLWLAVPDHPTQGDEAHEHAPISPHRIVGVPQALVYLRLLVRPLKEKQVIH